MTIALSEASAARCGSKAASLAVLMGAGLPVPDGFVVPFTASAVDDAAAHQSLPTSLREAVARELDQLADPIVAVRSSAAAEDTAEASAAGQYESILGVRGADSVCEAITTCQASAHAGRVAAYLHQTGQSLAPRQGEMAVIVQRLVAADISGVMFTGSDISGSTQIEASWGLGLSVVGGTVTPDSYRLAADGSVECRLGRKTTRIDPDDQNGGVIAGPVAEDRQLARTLDDEQVAALAALGHRIAEIFECPQDIEWAIAEGRIWILQARPITATPPSPSTEGTSEIALIGTPGAHGSVTARARIVRGPSDFSAVRPGEIMVCPFTDPAWTPLFGFVAGIITETGGALSHAAIVAREYGIPAVLGVSDATTSIHTGDRITLDGTAGTIIID